MDPLIVNFGRLRSMQRFRQTHRLDFFTPRQVRNRSSQFQDVMMGPRTQIELGQCRPHQALTFFAYFAELLDLSHTHIGVADDSGGLGVGRLAIGKSSLLKVPGGLHSCTDTLGSSPILSPLSFS
jgi:hypothetical protein